MNNTLVNKLTFKTMNWIFHNKYESRFGQCTRPEEVKASLYKMLGLQYGENERFDKGNRLVNYNAIFAWFQDNKNSA